MARQIRKKSGTGIYHIMLRGINRQDIFEDDEDYYYMIHILKGMTERFDEHGVRLTPLCTFYAFCLMSNHIHLLIQEREEDISGIVKRVGVAMHITSIRSTVVVGICFKIDSEVNLLIVLSILLLCSDIFTRTQ